MNEEFGCTTLSELFRRSVQLFGPYPFLGTKRGPSWVWKTYAEIGDAVENVLNRLSAWGVRPGDRVAVIADNREEWALCAYACYRLGAVLVPMYESQTDADWLYILHDCRPTIIFTANDGIRDRLRGKLPEDVSWLVSFDDVRPPSSALAEMPRNSPRLAPFSYLRLGSAHASEVPPPNADDLACLIYTSGTTGKPKGVMLTHRNIISNIEAVLNLGVMELGDTSLAFLPWAHVFGHCGELHGMLTRGGAVAISSGIPNLAQDLAEVRPTVLFTVPSVFNKVYAAVHAKVATSPGIIRHLFEKGLEAAARRQTSGSAGPLGSIQLLLADLLIFRKARNRFGGRIRLAVCGGAALSADVARFIESLGIPVCEGYGMTEASPIISVNTPTERKLGTGGKVIPGVTLCIDTTVTGDELEGEIVVKGPNVMKGYYNMPEETAKAIGPNGELRTGDLGHLDEEGFLVITGRLGERYKLENGKYVAPSPLEEKIRTSPLVANVMVYGLNKPHNVALIVPNMEALRAQLNGDGQGKDGQALLEDPKAIDAIKASVTQALTDCKGYERVQNVVLIGEDFTMENGLLTPTLKIKRKAVLDRYGAMLERLYV